MRHLIPLDEWVCDTCGEIIEKAEDGYLCWLQTTEANPHLYQWEGFHIIHHAPKSPHNHCYPAEYVESGTSLATLVFVRDLQDIPLPGQVGADGIAWFLAQLEVHHQSLNENHGRIIKGFSGFIEVFRRLTIPHYEEARLYFSADPDLDGAFPEYKHRQEIMRSVIASYGPQD